MKKTLAEKLERAIELNRQVETHLKDIDNCQFYINSWSKPYDTKEHIAEYMEKNTHFGCAGCLLVLASFVSAVLLFLGFSLAAYYFNPYFPQTMKQYIPLILGLTFMGFVILFFSVKRRRLLKRATELCEFEAENSKEHAAQIPEYERQVSQLNKELRVLYNQSPIKTCYLPIASKLIVYVRKERADTLEEALSLFVRDEAHEKKMSEYREWLANKQQEQQLAQQNLESAQAFHQAAEEARYYASIDETLEIIRSFKE